MGYHSLTYMPYIHVHKHIPQVLNRSFCLSLGLERADKYADDAILLAL